jgi:hypothetical protein
MSAWLSRVLGRKRYYMISVGLFTATSFLCGIAPGLNFLVIFRVLQGNGGGGLAPVEQAILVDTFPANKRAAAFALYSVAIVTAPDYAHYALARAVQGFGYAFLFVPVSVLAYSYLPPGKNNKGSSLTNLARNWGGSFGVAFITTVHERRTDLHTNRLSQSADVTSPLFHSRIDALTKTFEHLGYSHFDAAQHAQGLLYNQLNQQASLIGFMDCFRMMAIPLALATKSFRPGGEASGGH